MLCFARQNLLELLQINIPNKINEEKFYLQYWIEFKYQTPNLVKIKEILDKCNFHSSRSKGIEALSVCRVEQQQKSIGF